MKGFYRIWGGSILLLFLGAMLFGWSFSPKRKVRDVPRSVRENPGIWRSHYYGGK